MPERRGLVLNPSRACLELPADVAAAHAELIASIDALVARHGDDPGALLPILQDLRATRGELSELAMQVVAYRLGAAATEVQGVVTFYSFLGVRPLGKHVIRVCRTLSCALAGAREVAAALEARLGVEVGGTTADGEVTLEWANCIGLCDTPPAALADDQGLGHLTPAVVGEVVAEVRAGGVRG